MISNLTADAHSYVGLALIVLGIILIISEAVVPSFGALGAGGLAAFVIGSIMLIDTDIPAYGISWALISPVAIITGLFSFTDAGMALRARKRPELPGKLGGECGADYVLMGQTWKPSFLFVFPQVQLVDTRKTCRERHWWW